MVRVFLEVLAMFVATVLSMSRGAGRHRQAERTENDQQNQFFHVCDALLVAKEVAFGAFRDGSTQTPVAHLVLQKPAQCK